MFLQNSVIKSASLRAFNETAEEIHLKFRSMYYIHT